MYQITLKTEEAVALLVATSSLGAASMQERSPNPAAQLIFLAAPDTVHEDVTLALREAMQKINVSHDPRRN